MKKFAEFLYENKSGDDSLHDWFSKSRSSDGKPGWVQLGGKYAGKPCAKQPGQKTKPKCGSSKMAAALNAKEEEKAFRRKNKEDKDPNRKGKAKNVATEEFLPEVKEDRAAKERRKQMQRELAKKHGLDITNVRDKRKLSSLMIQKGQEDAAQKSGDDRTGVERRKDNVINRKAFDAERTAMKQRKTKKGTKEREIIDKKLENFRKEVRASALPPDPTTPSTREKVKVKVGKATTKLPDTPSTERGGASAQKRAERKSYEAQQRRNKKEDMKEELVTEKKDACYHKVKSRYRIWPSAYASGALVKCRKVGAKNWGNKTKKEEYEYSDWREEYTKGMRKKGQIKVVNTGETLKKSVENQIMTDPDLQLIKKRFKKEEFSPEVPSIEEKFTKIQETGKTYHVRLNWKGRYLGIQIFFPQFNRPSKMQVTSEVEKLYPGAMVISYQPHFRDPTKAFLYAGTENESR